ncbi:MAG: prolyl oligopeptidase family serine peptidase [Phycisphaerales bacterium]
MKDMLKAGWFGIACAVAVAMTSMAQAQAAAFEGLWIGRTQPKSIDCVLDVKQEKGALVVHAAVPAFGVDGVPVADAAVAEGVLRGTLTPMVGAIKLELRREGEQLAGAMLMVAPGTTKENRLALTLERTARAKQVDGARTWSGVLGAPGGALPMRITLAPDPHHAGGWCGAIDIPDQGVDGLPLAVSRNAPEQGGGFVLRIPVAVPALLALTETEGKLRGTFSQGEFRAPISFVPGNAGLQAQPERAARPQDPKPPFPYTERPVRVKHPSGHELAGTLTLPKDASPTARVPAVLLVTGSGPQDRDESLLGHRPFLVLSDALARAGIAVLRCDDRGVGESTGNFATATTRDFATDAAAAFAALAAAPEVDPARVGILGHSEGGVIAPMAAVALDAAPAGAPRPAFLVLMAGTGVVGSEILRLQTERIMLAAGIPAERLEPVRVAHAALTAAVLADADQARLLELSKALVAAQLQAGGTDPATIPDATLEQQARGAVQQVTTPWMRTFLALDPRVALVQVRVPVLALNGTLDTQVIPEQNLPAIEAALREAGAPVTVRRYEGLNHLFQPATTGSPQEYANIETTIDPKVLAEIPAWIWSVSGQRAGAPAAGAPAGAAPGRAAPAPPASR